MQHRCRACPGARACSGACRLAARPSSRDRSSPLTSRASRPSLGGPRRAARWPGRLPASSGACSGSREPPESASCVSCAASAHSSIRGCRFPASANDRPRSPRPVWPDWAAYSCRSRRGQDILTPARQTCVCPLAPARRPSHPPAKPGQVGKLRPGSSTPPALHPTLPPAQDFEPHPVPWNGAAWHWRCPSCRVPRRQAPACRIVPACAILGSLSARRDAWPPLSPRGDAAAGQCYPVHDQP